MLTTFQRQYITQLTQRPDFEHICRDYLNDDYEKERAFMVLFYTKDGVLHGHALGRKRLLRAVTSAEGVIYDSANRASNVPASVHYPL